MINLLPRLSVTVKFCYRKEKNKLLRSRGQNVDLEPGVLLKSFYWEVGVGIHHFCVCVHVRVRARATWAQSSDGMGVEKLKAGVPIKALCMWSGAVLSCVVWPLMSISWYQSSTDTLNEEVRKMLLLEFCRIGSVCFDLCAFKTTTSSSFKTTMCSCFSEVNLVWI